MSAVQAVQAVQALTAKGSASPRGGLAPRRTGRRIARLVVPFGHTILPLEHPPSVAPRPLQDPARHVPLSRTASLMPCASPCAERTWPRRRSLNMMPGRRRRGSRTPPLRRRPSRSCPPRPSANAAGFGVGRRPSPTPRAPRHKALRHGLALVPMGAPALADDLAVRESVHRLLHLAAVLALYHAGLEALQEHAVDAAELEVVAAGL